MLNRRIQVRMDFAKHSHVGPGKIELLEAIRHAGSLSQAARDLKISYRHAWQLAESLKSAFQSPVTLATRGGNGGGGICLTGLGESLVDSYRALEREFGELAASRLQDLTAMTKEPGTLLFALPIPIMGKLDHQA
jgi:molybdate transport system regulatory protein